MSKSKLSMRKSASLLLFFILVGCKISNSKIEGFGSFEKIDSIQFSIPSDLIFQDLDPAARKIIFLKDADSKKEVILTDFEGNIITTFLLTDTLNSRFDHLLTPISFQSDRFISVFGSKELRNYDLVGKIEQLFQVPPNLEQQISKSTSYDVTDNSLYFSSTMIMNLKNKDLKRFKTVKALERINLETGDLEFLIKLPESSIFQNGKYFLNGDWSPIIELDKDKIHIIFGIEPQIYTYSKTPPFDLLSSTPLELFNFQVFDGFKDFSSTLGLNSHLFSSGRFSSIQKLNSGFLISYFPGFDSSELKDYLATMSTEDIIKTIREVKGEHSFRLVVIDSLGKPLADFVPIGFDINKIIIKNGEIWIPENLRLSNNSNQFKIYKIKIEKVY